MKPFRKLLSELNTDHAAAYLVAENKKSYIETGLLHPEGFTEGWEIVEHVLVTILGKNGIRAGHTA